MNIFSQKFHTISSKYPNHTAIEYGDNLTITYNELNQAVDNHIIKLKESGIIPGFIAAVTLDKSIEYIITLLALWRMDCVLLPIIPELPELRRQHILDIAKPNALINIDGIQLIHSTIRTYTEKLASIFFTSGSTGKPKGVMVPHTSLVNVLEQQIQLFDLNETSRTLLLLSPQFDASLSDIGTTLLSGACLVISSNKSLLLASRIYETIAKKQITHLDIPPSLLARLDPKTLPSSIKTLIIGGETCPIKTIKAFSRRCKLINVYGPTEATICTSMAICSPNSDQAYIGDPISPNEYLIIDDDLNPLKGEAAGELLISSPGLAVGYMDDPELTDRKFIFIQGKRYFKTGDLVRRYKNNQIAILGRKDRQLKIRGQLVCLEEIEQALKKITKVTNSLVIPFKRGSKTTQLIAFIECKQSIESDSILNQLKDSLPDWMIPSKCYQLTQLFTNANGKIDPDAHLSYLKKMENDYCQLIEKNNSEKLNEIEKTLQFIWKSTLELKKLPSLDSHFFNDLGGDSLTAIEMITRCEKHNIKLPLGAIEKLSTIRLLSQWLLKNHDNPADVFVMKGKQLISIADKEKHVIDQFICRINKKAYIKNKIENEKTILITGCTGFIGSYLLSRLLLSKFKIICLVRSTSHSNAKHRVMMQMKKNGLFISHDDLESLEILSVDLSQDYFGLDKNHWFSLTERVDEVFHLAAAVNMTSPFDVLYSDNILATANILRFCLTNKRKKLHYTSTLSVLLSTNQNAVQSYEENHLNQFAEIYGGYAQTKWAAEYLVSQYSSQIPINIFRLGLITGNSVNGHSSQNDLLIHFLEATILSQSFPTISKNKEYYLSPTPIDYAVNAMLYISQNEQSGFFHIINDTNFSLALIQQALSQHFPNIKTIPLVQWREQLVANFKNNKRYLATYMSVSRQLIDRNHIEYNPLDLFQITNINIVQTNTKKSLINSNVCCPPADINLLIKYIAYCQEKLAMNKYQQANTQHLHENN
ncbi:NAD-dependent epimerase/dehydratase family protein [Legionella pneumophila]|uniref:thioester reductase domain-containing protein n=1 Tax=Legionella pneumophila TaxID=446 RepID=UPI00047FC8A2|nr:thioester reductase domain-containing protein [Legionella pneumophila]RYW87195.1 NAD-dependent epimerase/dehydratase family protein [Legionella pneumophila]STX99388.1 peptide synthetase, non-ribosomal [Legionella pneumophila]HAT1776256.1 AMP-binding protein [Legionella pneumophila]HAT1779278.1 AMP-binding protein [Legionella pneumophila]HAT2019416.1 AMP-binding protein [Legionella pneumophila]